MNTDAKIESLLFYKGEPMQIKKVAEILSITEGEVRDALLILKERQTNSGLTIVENGNEVSIGTNKEASDFLEVLRRDELSKELSKSALETLSIILYSSGATRSEIDYIRGVNSSFILRNLAIRGLVEKKTDVNDTRRFIYSPTIETLQFMGVSRVQELPDYENVIKSLQAALQLGRDTANE